MQGWLWSVVAACAVLAVVCGVADRRRAGRADVDAVGIMPWPTIQFAALFAGLIVAALALSG